MYIYIYTYIYIYVHIYMYNKYFYTYFNCLLLLKNFLILAFNIGYMQLGILWTLSLSLLVIYDWVLKLHISSKSNKQFMLDVTSGSELF